MTDPDDEILDRMVETLKEPAGLDPGLPARVMAALERQPGLPWARRRWTIRLSPLGGLAAAAGLVAVAFGAARLVPRPEPAPSPLAAATAGREGGPGRPTQFVLVAPDAAAVTVVGDFNDWSVSATPLARTEGDGLWWVTVPLPPGRYRYAFLVDGITWRNDPDSPAVEDEFGRANSVVTIGGL